MIRYIEKRIRRRKNLGTIRLSLKLAAALLPGRAESRLSRLIFEGRFLVETSAHEFQTAEALLAQRLRKASLPLWIVGSYIAKVVNTGRAKRLDEIAASGRLSQGPSMLLKAAVLRRAGEFEKALQCLQDGNNLSGATPRYLALARRSIYHQLRDHERLAEDGLDFFQGAPEHIDLKFIIAIAASAEAANREDFFAAAINRLAVDISRIEASRRLSRKHLADVVIAKMTQFDIDGAEQFLNHEFVSKTRRATRLRNQLKEIRKEIFGFEHVVEAARNHMANRALGVSKLDKTLPVFIVPAAAFRSNKVDYPTFRSDIRFVLRAITQAFETNGIQYQIASRIRTHGIVDLPVPFVSYHTVSNGTYGLHFKETDRPSLFSFDNRGYAGWSSFSASPVDRSGSNELDESVSDLFFRSEQASIIGPGVTKYAQPTKGEPLPDRFIFVALQLPGDAVSALAYQSPTQMLEEVTRVARDHGLAVVVKRHPLCKALEITSLLTTLETQDHVYVVDGDIHHLIANSEAVCVVNSGVGAEALLHEKPVYVFGRSDYMNACIVCEQPGDFTSEFSLGKSRLSKRDLHKFWYIYRKRYAVDVTHPESAYEIISTKLLTHLRECGQQNSAEKIPALAQP